MPESAHEPAPQVPVIRQLSDSTFIQRLDGALRGSVESAARQAADL